MKIYPYVLFSENVNYSPLYSDRQEASGEKETKAHSGGIPTHNFDEVLSISCGHFPLDGTLPNTLFVIAYYPLFI